LGLGTGPDRFEKQRDSQFGTQRRQVLPS
jgi:hypothetical protein